MASITSTLGSGSGIDTQALVAQLVAASYDPKKATLSKREESNSAKVSTLATLTAGIDGFASALSSLIAGGTLQTQPVSSDASVLTAAAKPGARLGDFSARIEVRAIAQAQTLASPALASATTAVGQGDLVLTTPAGSATITIDATNNTLAGLARAINAANEGVSASVVTDTSGARLVLKGQTGAASGFTLTAGASADADLQRFTWDGASGGLTRTQAAGDATIVADGVTLTRATNSIDDLVDGVTLNLVSARPGTTISLGANRPTAAITQGLDDFVTAYNALKGEIDKAVATGADGGGAFAGSSTLRSMQRQLAKLTSTVLNTTGGPATLAEVGVSTGRDGTLTLDKTRLAAALARDPDGVEALFNPTQYASSPLIKITSALGAAKPGTYALADIVPSDGTNSASGKIGGVNGVGLGTKLLASVGSAAYGLTIEPQGALASGTVTVDAGLGGALKAIRDQLRATDGALGALGQSLTAEKKTLAGQRLKLTDQEGRYKDQLTKSFGAMDARVNAYKATQSYLKQQISIWTKGDD